MQHIQYFITANKNTFSLSKLLDVLFHTKQFLVFLFEKTFENIFTVHFIDHVRGIQIQLVKVQLYKTPYLQRSGKSNMTEWWEQLSF